MEGRIYSLPKTPPLLPGAAVTEATAEFVGGWADGLLTVSGKPEQIREVVEAFRRGGEGKPLFNASCSGPVKMRWLKDWSKVAARFDQ